jgi:hypothetical protein
MATDDKALHAELDLLRALAKSGGRSPSGSPGVG